MRMRLPARARLAATLPYVVLLGVSAYLYVNAGEFARFARPGELGPDFWPRAILVVLMIVCVGATVSRLIGPAHEAQSTARDAADATAPLDAAAGIDRSDDARSTPAAELSTHPYLLAGGIALSAAYVAALDALGFFVATALYLGIFMALGRYRRVGVIVATSVIGSLVFVVVFMKIVYVSLPLGQGPFRALSAALLSVLGVH